MLYFYDAWITFKIKLTSLHWLAWGEREEISAGWVTQKKMVHFHKFINGWDFTLAYKQLKLYCILLIWSYFFRISKDFTNPSNTKIKKNFLIISIENISKVYYLILLLKEYLKIENFLLFSVENGKDQLNSSLNTVSLRFCLL